MVPLLATEPTAAPMAGPYDAIVLTSAAGAREAAERRAPDLPVHAIGHATAEAARGAGFSCVTVGVDGTPAPDGGALGRMLAAPRNATTLLYPCAEDRRPGLERELRAGGIHVDAWPLYRTVALPDGLTRIADALEGERPTAILLHSPTAARALRGVDLGRAPVLCLSPAIAAALPSDVGGERCIAARPDEASLLALLDEAR